MARFSTKHYIATAELLSDSFKLILKDMQGVAGSAKMYQIESNLCDSFYAIADKQAKVFADDNKQFNATLFYEAISIRDMFTNSFWARKDME